MRADSIVRDDQLSNDTFAQLAATVNSPLYDTCGKCITGVQILHQAASTQSVDSFINIVVAACENLLFEGTYLCEAVYSGVADEARLYMQLFAKMSLATQDMQGFCFYQYAVCTRPATIVINETAYFSPKPANKTMAPKPSGMYTECWDELCTDVNQTKPSTSSISLTGISTPATRLVRRPTALATCVADQA